MGVGSIFPMKFIAPRVIACLLVLIAFALICVIQIISNLQQESHGALVVALHKSAGSVGEMISKIAASNNFRIPKSWTQIADDNYSDLQFDSLKISPEPNRWLNVHVNGITNGSRNFIFLGELGASVDLVMVSRWSFENTPAGESKRFAVVSITSNFIPRVMDWTDVTQRLARVNLEASIVPMGK